MGEWAVYIFQVTGRDKPFYISQYSVTPDDAIYEIKKHMIGTGWKSIGTLKFLLVKEYDTINDTDIDAMTTPYIMVGGME